MRTNQVFFGDFLSPHKKLPAAQQRKLRLRQDTKIKGKELDSGFRRNDERKDGPKVGFQLPLE